MALLPFLDLRLDYTISICIAKKFSCLVYLLLTEETFIVLPCLLLCAF